LITREIDDVARCCQDFINHCRSSRVPLSYGRNLFAKRSREHSHLSGNFFAGGNVGRAASIARRTLPPYTRGIGPARADVGRAGVASSPETLSEREGARNAGMPDAPQCPDADAVVGKGCVRGVGATGNIRRSARNGFNGL
jgi:hypothetical protein